MKDVYDTILRDFREYGQGVKGYDRTRMSVFLGMLGVPEAEIGELLAKFDLTAAGDELDFEAFVTWLFDGVDAGYVCNTADLAPKLLEELQSCPDALEHVMYVQPSGTTDADAAEALHKLIGGSRQSRIGVIGSLHYDFPGIRYAAEGPKGVESLVQAAAQGMMRNGKPCRVVCGGSYGGPQRSFAEACEEYASRPLAMVHVIPNTEEALADLKGIIWDGSAPRRRKCRWKLAFVGLNWSRRNCILASLNGNYVMCAGGPGTHTELSELRAKGAGLLPLVCSGGLCEGVEFDQKNVRGMTEALRQAPPEGVPEESWRIMLGEGAATSFERYCASVSEVFGALQFRSSAEPKNRWPMDEKELREWTTYRTSAVFVSAPS